MILLRTTLVGLLAAAVLLGSLFALATWVDKSECWIKDPDGPSRYQGYDYTKPGCNG